MLGKLVKDEMKSYRFSLGIVLLIGLVFTVFFKIICMLPLKEDAKGAIQILFCMGFALVLFLMSVATIVLIIVRFYSTMVGDRGYLTWTLPATAKQLIGAKLIGGILWQLIMFFVMFVYGVIFMAGSYWIWMQDYSQSVNLSDISMGQILQILFNQIGEQIDTKMMTVFALQLVIVALRTVVGMLIVYMCIAIGQIFGKWRILATIGSYFLVMIVQQILNVVFMATTNMQNAFSQYPTMYYESDPAWMESIISQGVMIGGYLFVGVGIYLLTAYIFEKHLNLD